MFTPALIDLLEHSDEDDHVVVIASVSARPDLAAIKMILDAGARRGALADFYERAKKPMMDEAKSLESMGLEVVSDLAGTHQAIFHVPATVLKKLGTKTGSVFAGDQVKLSANSPSIQLPAR